MASSGDVFVKIFAAVLLLAMGLLGLAMTVCGVMFIGSDVAVVAMMSILVGLLLIFGAIKLSIAGTTFARRSGDDPPSDRGP